MPQIDAAITFPPFSTATNLYPETKNSLARTIIGIQASILSSSTNNTNADNTNILSANGSKNLPNVVTWFLERAIYPSSLSVIDATINISNIQKYVYGSP